MGPVGKRLGCQSSTYNQVRVQYVIVVVSLRFIKTADLQVFSSSQTRLSSLSVSQLLKLVRLAQDEPGDQDDEDDDDGDESSLSDGADLRQVVLFYSPSPPVHLNCELGLIVSKFPDRTFRNF